MTISETRHRVNYSETDQMGVVYHANYLVWLDVARTEYLRTSGMAYGDLEARGYFLAVAELAIRYLAPARFDDEIRVRCWVRELRSRRVTFAYIVERVADGARLVTAETAMFVLDRQFRPTRLPEDAAALLTPVPDPA